jgi:hypothetical protein
MVLYIKMMFNNRMIRTEMLTARQLSIADLGVDILRNSQSFFSKHLMASILDLGFRCINDSEGSYFSIFKFTRLKHL